MGISIILFSEQGHYDFDGGEKGEIPGAEHFAETPSEEPELRSSREGTSG